MSGVRSNIYFFLQSGAAIWWRVCDLRGLPRLVYKERQKLDTLAVINNCNFYDTQRQKQTWRFYDQHGPEGRVSEN